MCEHDLIFLKRDLFFTFETFCVKTNCFHLIKCADKYLFPSPIIYTLSRKFFKAKSNKMILINWKQKFWILIHSKRFFGNAQERRTNQRWPGWTHKQLYRAWWHETSYTTSHVLIGSCVSSFLPYTVRSVEIIFSCTCTIPRT